MSVKLTREERETICITDDASKEWIVDTSSLSMINKLTKAEWECVRKTYYSDGTISGATFKAPKRCISFRNPNKKRVMSEEHINAMLEGRKKLQKD